MYLLPGNVISTLPRLGQSTPDRPIQDKFIDKWTLAHLAIGTAYAWLRFDAKTALSLSLAWELVENLYLIPSSQDWHYESFLNVCGDIAGNMAGYFLAKKGFRYV